MTFQRSLLSLAGSSYVQSCLDRGAVIVPSGTKCEGAVILCPGCHAEDGLDPTFDGARLVSFRCDCGKKFKDEDAALLTFKVTGTKKKAKAA